MHPEFLDHACSQHTDKACRGEQISSGRKPARLRARKRSTPSSHVAEFSRDSDFSPMLTSDMLTEGARGQTSSGRNASTVEDAQISCPMLPAEYFHHADVPCYACGRHTGRGEQRSNFNWHKCPSQAMVHKFSAPILPAEYLVVLISCPMLGGDTDRS